MAEKYFLQTVTRWKHRKENNMRKKDKEFFEYMEKNFKTPPEIAELFYYFDRRVVRYRLIIAVLLMIIVLLIIFKP